MHTVIERARSFLFVPASRPERFVKALQTPASCVVLDLEDAVAADQKVAARDQLAVSLSNCSRENLGRTLVRINAEGTPWHADDVGLLAEWIRRGLGGVMVPKAESAAMLDAIGASLGGRAQLVPLVESLQGVDMIDQLTRVAQVSRIAFGHLDFQLDLDMRSSTDEIELMPVRFALVAASRRAHLPAPIDGVTVDTGNRERQLADAQRSRALGFGGKLCIHPAQVVLVNETFKPLASEVEWARRVVDGAQAQQGRTFSLDGRMIDLPVVRLAEKTLSQAQEALPANGSAV